MNNLLDDTPLTFGKHKGKTPNKIAVINPQYIIWMYDNLDKKFCTTKLRNQCKEMLHDDDEWHNLAQFYDEADPW